MLYGGSYRRLSRLLNCCEGVKFCLPATTFPAWSRSSDTSKAASIGTTATGRRPHRGGRSARTTSDPHQAMEQTSSQRDWWALVSLLFLKGCRGTTHISK